MSLFQSDLRLWFQTVAFIALAVAAWRWGGGPERWLAAVLVWFRGADIVNHGVFGPWSDLSKVNAGHVAIDAVALAVSLAVAVRANRMYPLWFAAFQLIAMLSHLARAMVPDIASIAYFAIFVIPSYCQIVILALGISAHRRRVARRGPHPDWLDSSRRSPRY